MNNEQIIQQKPSLQRVLISGGGTGGHIFPAISIANAIRRRFPDADIRFVGADNRMEMERVPAAGYPIEGLSICGFDRKNLFRNISVLIKLRRAISKARSIVRDFKPQIAIGVGGYASGPTLKAAQRLGVPTLIQEQNSYAGVTNKLLAKKAGRICVAYDGMERFFPAGAIVKTGNPVRKNLLENSMTQSEAKISLSFDPEKPLLLVVGGSLGARTINESIAASITDLPPAASSSSGRPARIMHHLTPSPAPLQSRVSRPRPSYLTWMWLIAQPILWFHAQEQAASANCNCSAKPPYLYPLPTSPRTISAKTPWRLSSGRQR